MSAKHAALASHIRRLCCLGSDPSIVIPHVVEAVRTIVDAEWGMFFYTNERYELTDVFSQNDAVFDVMPTYFSEIHNTEKQSVLGVDFATAMRRGKGYENSIQYDAALLGSALYGELWHPLRLRHSLEMTASDGRRGWGSLQLARPLGSRPFSQKNLADISQFSRHIAHAILCPTVTHHQFSACRLSTVLVIDRSGKVLLQNADGSRMLALASGESQLRQRNLRLPDWLIPVISSFDNIWRGRVSPPPVLERCNAAGRFVFKAYRFSKSESFDGTSIALYAEHFPPLDLEIERVGFQLGLSERQRELCAYLMQAHSHRDIARKMCIRESTVVDHLRKIYTKLDIHGHDELRLLFMTGKNDGRTSDMVSSSLR